MSKYRVSPEFFDQLLLSFSPDDLSVLKNYYRYTKRDDDSVVREIGKKFSFNLHSFIQGTYLFEKLSFSEKIEKNHFFEICILLWNLSKEENRFPSHLSWYFLRQCPDNYACFFFYKTYLFLKNTDYNVKKRTFVPNQQTLNDRFYLEFDWKNAPYTVLFLYSSSSISFQDNVLQSLEDETKKFSYTVLFTKKFSQTTKQRISCLQGYGFHLFETYNVGEQKQQLSCFFYEKPSFLMDFFEKCYGELSIDNYMNIPKKRPSFSLKDLHEEDFDSDEEYEEGKRYNIQMTHYERNKGARDRCIEIYGSNCYICGFSFQKMYGAWGEGYIHVHHETPLSLIGETYKVNPKKDLKPVCPNCHAMLHHRNRHLSIEELKRKMKKS